MGQITTEPIPFPSPPEVSPEDLNDVGRVPDDPLKACLRDSARKMLIQAVEAEVAQWVDERAHLIPEEFAVLQGSPRLGTGSG